MELDILSPGDAYRHSSPGATTEGEEQADEEERHVSSNTPPAPTSNHVAASLMSRLNTWWSTHIQLVIKAQTSTPSRLHSSSSATDQVEDQAEDQAEGQVEGQAKDLAHDQDQNQTKDDLKDQVKDHVKKEAKNKAKDDSKPRPQPQPQQQPQNNNTKQEKKAETNLDSDPEPDAEEELPIHDPRDFLALERTFLAYVRTSVALVSFGVIVTQLFVLKKAGPVKGAVVGGISEAAGIVVVLVGCVRYFRQQRLLVEGKTMAAGWDLIAVLGVLGGVLVAMLVVVLIQQ